MALHRLKIIAGQELKSIVTQLFVPKVQKRKKKMFLWVLLFEIRLSLHQMNAQRPRTPTRIARISELRENNLRAEGMGMGDGLFK